MKPKSAWLPASLRKAASIFHNCPAKAIRLDGAWWAAAPSFIIRADGWKPNAGVFRIPMTGLFKAEIAAPRYLATERRIVEYAIGDLVAFGNVHVQRSFVDAVERCFPNVRWAISGHLNAVFAWSFQDGKPCERVAIVMPVKL